MANSPTAEIQTQKTNSKTLSSGLASSGAMSSREQVQMRRALQLAIQDSDEWVVELEYMDSKGERTRRVVSPIRFLGADRVLGLCLSREEPRQFYLQRCRNVQLKHSVDYLMPVPMLACEPMLVCESSDAFVTSPGN